MVNTKCCHQLKSHWLAPGVWGHYVWKSRTRDLSFCNHDVCPSAYVGSFVKYATGDVVVDDSTGSVEMIPMEVPFLDKR